jgi:hypothetical protein
MRIKEVEYSSDRIIKTENRDYHISHNLMYEARGAWKPLIKTRIKLLDKLLPLVLEHIDVDMSVVTIRLRKLNKKYGQAWGNFVELSLPYLTLNADVLNAISHELVHVEQFQQGRLTSIIDKNYKIIDVFEGKEYADGHALLKTDIEAYNETPWEKEAYRRQEQIYKLVRPILDKEGW